MNSPLNHHFCFIFDAEFSQVNDKEIWFSITGNRFLHNMVRIIIGTILELYVNERNPVDLKRIIEQKNRNSAGRTAPPHGLYLNKITY